MSHDRLQFLMRRQGRSRLTAECYHRPMRSILRRAGTCYATGTEQDQFGFTSRERGPREGSTARIFRKNGKEK